MHLQSLRLKNFRLHRDLFLEFGQGATLVHGSNAIGKTTILEAIHLLMMGRSFRTFQIQDLVGNGGTAFHVEAVFLKHQVEQKLTVSFDGNERKIQHNDTQFRRLTDIVGIIQGVCMTPDDVAIVKGAPELRRRYLDFQLSQTDGEYLHQLTRYARAMRQRNQLLKSNDVSTIEEWEQEMANAASYIVMQRYAAVAELQVLIQKLFHIFSGDHREIAIAYESSAPLAGREAIHSFYMEKYRTMRPREIDAGITLSGPQRDDLKILLDRLDVRHFASEGQQRMCVASLKFAEWERVRQQANLMPLMLIDDVGVSLDDSRRDKLMHHLESLGQVFLTATDNKTRGAQFASVDLSGSHSHSHP
jgi:DNA replication and repair protein RecF